MIRLAIVDDHAVVRTGLKEVLSSQVDLAITAQAASGAEAIAIAREGNVDVMLMDLSMPDLGGVEALKQIKAIDPDLAVLVVSSYPEEHYATNLIGQGASGYIGKDCEPEELARAVRTVYRGKKYMSTNLAAQLAVGLERGASGMPHELLSERERQVFYALAGGKSIGKISEAMDLSVKTVSTYRTRIMDKMNLTSNSDLTYYAMTNKLIA